MFTVFKKCLSSTYDFVMASAATTVNQLGSYAHNPRGNLWFNDESSYGQRMLLKMGWNKGKGLGKKEDGITENLKVKFKSTNAGLGYKDDPCANIMKTEYESILKDLSTEYSQQKAESSSNKGKKEHKNKVCKPKSKVIKRNIRYPKLFYGKDVSKYSEEDMKGIFICSFPSLIKRKKEPMVKCEAWEIPKSNTYSSPLSINDYFGLKNKEKKDNELKKSLSEEIKSENTVSPCSEFECADPVPSGKKRKERGEKAKLHENKCDDPIILEGKDKDVTDLNKKQILPQNVTSDYFANKKMEEKAECNENSQPTPPSKKRKKSHKKVKSCNSDPDVLSCHIDMHENTLNLPCKKSKKSFKNVTEEASNSVELVSVSSEIEVSEKSKEINNISTSGSDVESSSKIKSEKPEEAITISSSGSLDDSSFTSNKRTIKKKKLKNRRRKLKSCLKSKKSKYALKSVKNVSFNEEIFYKLVESYLEPRRQAVPVQEPQKYNPKCAHIHKMIEDSYDPDRLYPDEIALEMLMMDCVCEKSVEESEPQKNSCANRALNVAVCSSSKQTNTANIADKSTSKHTNILNVPGSSTSKKTKRKKEYTVSVEEPVEVCNSLTDLPSSNSSHYNSWIESQKLALKMKMYKNMLKCIKTHDVLKTTNLSSIKGYGNWGFN